MQSTQKWQLILLPDLSRFTTILIPPGFQMGSISRFLKQLLFSLTILAYLGIAAILALTAYYSTDLPQVHAVAITGTISSKILDKDGNILYEIHGETKRSPVPLEEISPNLTKATLAIEDKNFYHHKGLSLKGIIRATINNVEAGKVVQGGSTISQQVIKNSLLTKEKSYDRKVKEVILAMQLEQNYKKDKILELYLNSIPYGRNSYGAEAASLAYFGKQARDLTLGESAYLAALPKAPSLLSPSRKDTSELVARKNHVLDNMFAFGMISKEDLQAAKNEKVVFRTAKTSITAPHFVKWVESELTQKYGRKKLEEDGLIIHTTLDSKLQSIAENAVAEGAAINSRKYNAHNASLVSIDPTNGYIVAMVGSKNYFASPEPAGCTPGANCLFEPNTNTAVAARQPGSSFKPYTYVTAFSKPHSFAPVSPILDRTQNFSKPGFEAYIPKNFNNKQYGLITMRKALAGSLNVAAVRTLSMVGVENVAKTAKTLGITTPLESCGLSLTLGACEVKLVEHVGGFATFANLGEKPRIIAVTKITDKYGNVLEEHNPERTQVLDQEAVYELVDIMKDNNARSFIFGKKTPLTLKDREVAAKTGTSNDFKDGWTLGFTPQLVAGVWVGNNDGTIMSSKADGVKVAAPIWNKFMEEAHKDLPVVKFKVPAGIQLVKVSPQSGLLATKYTRGPITEVFASFSVPTKQDAYRPPPPPIIEQPAAAEINLSFNR